MKVKIHPVTAVGWPTNDLVEISATHVRTPKFRGPSWEEITRTDKNEEVVGNLQVTKGGYFKRDGQWYRINLRDERTWA